MDSFYALDLHLSSLNVDRHLYKLEWNCDEKNFLLRRVGWGWQSNAARMNWGENDGCNLSPTIC